MGMMNKIALKGMVICIAFIGLAITQCEASSLDKYRSILESRCYTLKFKVITDSSLRLLANDVFADTRLETAYNPNEFKGLPKDMEKKIQEKAEKNFDVIVMDGETRYTEIMGKCKLIKNGEVFTYMHDYIDDKYYGGGRFPHFNEIAPGINNWMTVDNIDAYGKKLEPEEIADIGKPMLMKLLAVIYPVRDVNVELPEYSFVSSGQSEEGSIYEDYVCETQNSKHVARCYFHNGELVKMAYASYPVNTDATANEVEKYIIEIKEFSNVPESKYFSLPSSLKVVRK